MPVLEGRGGLEEFVLENITRPPKGVGRESFGYLLQILSRRMETQMKQRLSEIGVDFRVFANLMVLAIEEGVNQRQLGQRSDFPEYYTSRNIDLLVKEDLAERRPDPNSRRSTLIYLTPKGREIANLLPDVVRQCNADFLTGLEDAERTELIRLMQKVVAATV